MFENHETVMVLIEPQTGAIVDINPAGARYYRHPRARMRSMNIEDLHLALHLLGGGPSGRRSRTAPVRIETTTRLIDGEMRSVEVHATRICVQTQSLLFGIIHDITERKALEQQVLDISEKERQRFGRDLHDSLGGKLTGAALLGKALSQTLAAKSIPESKMAEEIVQCMNEAISQTRSIAHGLCPAELSEFGLVGSLREYADKVERRFSVSCTVEAPPALLFGNEVAAAHLFRIVQESVNNALRHGKARKILIRLSQIRGHITLEIRDNGVGLPANLKQRQGLGLRTMKHRADMIGAQFAVERAEPRGTMVTCSLPVAGAAP